MTAHALASRGRRGTVRAGTSGIDSFAGVTTMSEISVERA